MDDELIILARDLVKTYRLGEVAVPALRGVSLEVPRGAMWAIMGPSGCGKTTLLNCLSGLDDVDSGEVWIAGRALWRMSDRAKTAYRARQMGFIFQFYNLLPVLSAVENVELPLLVGGTSGREARRRAEEVLDLVGLADRRRHRPGELSGGQIQRVTIARALVARPAIVWADEPTGDLDSETQVEVLELIERLNREEGQTFVIVTHAPEVGARCGRIIRMKDGVIVE
jgi:putative ABC transport system ATP-binding protein